MPEESNKGWYCKKGVKLKFVCCWCSTKIACPVWPWALLLVWASGFFQSFGQFIAVRSQGWHPANERFEQCLSKSLHQIVPIVAEVNVVVCTHYSRHVVVCEMGCDYQIWHSFSSVCGLAKADAMMCTTTLQTSARTSLQWMKLSRDGN